MTGDGTDALEQALALHAMPRKLSLLRDRALPDAVLLLIRIASGNREAIMKAAARSAETPQVVTDAAVLYIEQVLFHESADSYRLLGVRPEAADDTIKEHYRWLMRWLHPDRHPDRWEVVYSERINRAWNTLSTEQRRRDYDARMPVPATGRTARSTPMPIVARHANPKAVQPVLSSHTVRRLPMLVFAALSIFACASLAMLYWMQRDRRSDPFTTSGDDATIPVEDGSPAQKAAFRRSVDFDEHVIELSQPVLPANMAKSPIAPAGQPAAATAPVTTATKPPATTVVATKATGTPSAQTPGVVPLTVSGSVQPREDKNAVASLSVQPASSSVLAQIPATSEATAGRAPTVAAHREGMTPQDAVVVVPREFADAYAQGDLATMMRLFAPHAIENRGGIAAIATDYDHLFRDSTSRELRLDRLKWTILPDRIIGSGAYEARILRADDPTAERVDGWIQIEAIPSDGRWKIQRILHRNAQ